MNLHVGHLRLPEFLVEPDQLTGGISGGGEEPQVEVVTEVTVEGDYSQACRDLTQIEKYLSEV